jgi:hypothetical protein
MAQDAHGRPDLDRWLSEPAVRTSHKRASRATPQALWRAADAVALSDCRLLGRLVALKIAGVAPATTFAAMFRTPPFVLLEEGETFAISGLCGRIWAVRGELGRLQTPADFRDWCEPGTARVLFAHWAQGAPGGGAMLHSEVRVAAVDRRALLYMRALEPFIAAFQGLVGREALALAVRRAGG